VIFRRVGYCTYHRRISLQQTDITNKNRQIF